MSLLVTYSGAASGTHNLEVSPLVLTVPGSYTFTFEKSAVVRARGVAGGGAAGDGEEGTGAAALGGGGGGGGASNLVGETITVLPGVTYVGAVGTGGSSSGGTTLFGRQSQTPILELAGGTEGTNAFASGPTNTPGVGGPGGAVVQGANGVAGGAGGDGGARNGAGSPGADGTGARGGGGGGGGGTEGSVAGQAGGDGGDSASQSGGLGGAGTLGTPFNAGGTASGIGGTAPTGDANDSGGGSGGGGGGALLNGLFWGGGGGGGGGVETSSGGSRGLGGDGDQGVLQLSLDSLVGVSSPISGSGAPRAKRLTQYLAFAAPMLAENPVEGAIEEWRPQVPDRLAAPRRLPAAQQAALSIRDPFPPTPPAPVPEQWQPQFTLPTRRKSFPTALLPTLASVVGNLQTVVVGWSFPDEIRSRLRLLTSGGFGPVLPQPGTIVAPTGGALLDSGVLATTLRFQYQALTGPLRVFPGVFQSAWQQLYPASVPRRPRAFAAQQALAHTPVVPAQPVPPYRPPLLVDRIARLWRPTGYQFIAQDLRQAQPAPGLSQPILPDWLPRPQIRPVGQTVLALLPTGLLDLSWYQQRPAWLPRPRLLPEGAWALGWHAVLPVVLEWQPQMPEAPPLRQPQREPTYSFPPEPIPNPPSPELAWKGYQPDWFPEPPFLRAALQQAWASDRIRPEAPDLSWQGWAPDQVRAVVTHPAIHPQQADQIEQPPAVFHEGWNAQYPDAIRLPRVVRRSDLWVPWEPTQAPGWGATFPAWVARALRRPFDLTPFEVGALLDVGERLGWQPNYPVLLWRPVLLTPSWGTRQPELVTPDSWCVILYAPEVRTPALHPEWLLLPALEDTALVTPTLADEEVC